MEGNTAAHYIGYMILSVVFLLLLIVSGLLVGLYRERPDREKEWIKFFCFVLYPFIGTLVTTTAIYFGICIALGVSHVAISQAADKAIFTGVFLTVTLAHVIAAIREVFAPDPAADLPSESVTLSEKPS